MGDMYLSRQGPLPLLSPNTSLIAASCPASMQQPWQYVSERHISQLGDLYSVSESGISEWHDFSKTAGRALIERQTGDPPTDPVTIRPFQFWLPDPRAHHPRNEIIEILGYTHHSPPLLNYRRLITNSDWSVVRCRDMRPSKDKLRGGASLLSLSPLELLGPTPQRVYLNSEIKSYRTVDFISSPTLYATTLPIDSPTQWFPPSFQLILASLGPFSIFTDGSWAQDTPQWDHITSNAPTYIGSVGIAIISDLPEWQDLPILTMHINNGQSLESLSAFSMESLGILVALSIASHLPSPEINIYSDCKSAVTKLQTIRSTNKPVRTKSRDASLTTASIDHWNKMEDVNISWVKGHPEKEFPDPALWTREMWGNHLSDRAAAGQLAFSTQYQYKDSDILSLTPIPTMEALLLTPHLVPQSLWYFGNSAKQLVSPSIMDRIHCRRLDTYLRDRDKHRANRSLPPQWAELNIPLAAKLWKLSSSSFMDNRLLFDKHYHSGNLAKKIEDIEEYAIVSKCPLCEQSDSFEHWSQDCCANRRAPAIRQLAISKVKAAISECSKLQSTSANKSSVASLGSSCLSFLVGDGKSPNVWKGLWTSAQLNTFGTSATLPNTLISVLKKLFHEIGGITIAAIIQLWQSRQLTIAEVAAKMKETPHPLYQEPKFIHIPSNTELVRYTDEELEIIVKSVTTPVVLPSKPTSTKSSRKKLLAAPPTVSAAVVVDLTQSDLVLPVLPVLPVIPPLQLKQDKFKKPKSRPPLSPNHRIRINEAKKTRMNWKLVLRAPDTTLTTGTAIDVHLTRSIPSTSTYVRPEPLQACPPSPPRVTPSNSSTSNSRLSFSFKRMGSLQDPVRGEDPDKHTVMAPTSYISVDFILIYMFAISTWGCYRISIEHLVVLMIVP
jgi:ribonuclease HI